MKGYKLNVKTGEIQFFDDGLPEPEPQGYTELKGIDLLELVEFLEDTDLKRLKMLIEYARSRSWID